MRGLVVPLSLMEISTPSSVGDTCPVRNSPALPAISTIWPGQFSVKTKDCITGLEKLG